ncbi:MAG: NADH-quinone oxidoreductase subunit J [Candidatus Zixiibacteriota bacterium]
MTLDTIIFLISSVVAVFGGTMMIAQRNPVASVLYMIVSLVAQAVLFIQLGALFLGAVLIIVYAGAILVLFLFVIMLLNLRGGEDLGRKDSVVSRMTRFTAGGLFLLELIFVVNSSLNTAATAGGIVNAPAVSFGTVEMVAELLFTRYLYPFELTSILLLSAIVGAVVIAQRRRNDQAPHLDSIGPVDRIDDGTNEESR